MSKPKLLIIQPGKFGDIIICLPIARYYSKEYDVHFQCPTKYHSIFNGYVDYCIPFENVNIYDYTKVIDLSFGIWNGKSNDWWNENKHTFDSFVTAKYYLANVDLLERWNLVYNRNIIRENELYDRLIVKNSIPDYVLTQQQSDGIYLIKMNINIPSIEFEPFEDYTIFDWYKIIEKSMQVHCIPSSLSNYIDVIPEFKDKQKTLYLSFRELKDYMFNNSIHTNNWSVV